MANNGALIVQSVMRNPSPYDPANQLTATAKVADAPNYLGISTDVPTTTVPEFLEYARAHPGELNYSSAGVGSFASLLAEALNANAELDVMHVSSNGSSAALMRNPIRFSETPMKHKPAPRFGEDTVAVLQEELELDAAAIDKLRQASVL